jgi:hypothetical protein
VIEDGLLWIGETVQMNVTGRYGDYNVVQGGSAGGTVLIYGSRLVVPQGFWMVGATLGAGFDAPGQVVTIDGNLDVTGGLVAMSTQDGNNHFYGTIMVEGNVAWGGGTYRAWIDGSDQMKRDLWRSTGTFDIANSATLEFQVLNFASAQQNQTWNILTSNTRVLGLPAVSQANSPEFLNYDLVTDGNNPVKELSLKRK